MPPRRRLVVEEEELDRDLKDALHRTQPGPFKGEGAKLGETTEAWIEAMDEYFDVAGYNGRSKMALARLKLVGVAKTNWKNHCESEHLILNQLGWEDIKAFLRSRFCPPGFNQDKLNQFLELTQGTRSVEEYHQAYSELLRFAPIMDEATLLDRFIRKLNPPLDALVKNANPTSVADVVAKAERFAKAFPTSPAPSPSKEGKRIANPEGNQSFLKRGKGNRGSSQNSGRMGPPSTADPPSSNPQTRRITQDPKMSQGAIGAKDWGTYPLIAQVVQVSPRISGPKHFKPPPIPTAKPSTAKEDDPLPSPPFQLTRAILLPQINHGGTIREKGTLKLLPLKQLLWQMKRQVNQVGATFMLLLSTMDPTASSRSSKFQQIIKVSHLSF